MTEKILVPLTKDDCVEEVISYLEKLHRQILKFSF